MKEITFALAATILCCTVGCQTTVEDKNTAAVDSTLAVLQSAKNITKTVDEAELERVYTQYKAYTDFYSTTYTDVSNRDFYTHELMDMAECTKRLGISKGQVRHWEEELDEAIERLEKLRHDYTNALITEAEFLEYFEQEKYPASHVNHEVDENLGSVSACLRNQEKLFAKLDSAKTAFLKSIE